MHRLLRATMAASITLIAGGASAQGRPPVIDMHAHAMGVNDNGPPPQAFCLSEMSSPAWDPAGPPWPAVLGGVMSNPTCENPVWSPTEQDELRDRTLAQFEKYNVLAVLSGPMERTAAWRERAPDRILPSWQFNVSREADATPADLVAAFESGQIFVFGEITNQYGGVAPDDPRMEPYWAAAEEHDIPVGIHIGLGPPGVKYMASPEYRASLHSALTLEPVLGGHPKLRVYVMHAGWPMTDDMIAMMWNHPQVYVDTGCIVFCVPGAAFHNHMKRLVDAGYADRIMFGSDAMTWPEALGYGIEVIEQAPYLTEQQKRDILYNNAKRFLRLPD